MSGRIAYYGNIVKDGLILDLDAAKRDSYPGTGTTWRDISGNGIIGTLTNGPVFDSANGGSIMFDGSNDYVTGSLSQNPTTFTINTWVNLSTNNTVGAAIFSTNGTGQTGNSFIFLQMGGGTKPFQFNNAADSVAPSLNVWYMVTGVQTATQQLVYVNASLKDTKTAAGTLGTSYIVGRRWDANYLNAKISNVQVYNRVLSATEITRNYNAFKGRYGL